MGLALVFHPALGFLVAELQGLATELDQAHPEIRRQLGAEPAFEHPIFHSFEGLDFPLAIHDEAHGDALHPARGKPAPHLVPQHLAHLVAHEPVQHAPGSLRVHQLLVDDRGIGHGLLNASGRDLVEQHPRHRQGFRGLDGLQQMPGDGLPFSIRVSGEDQFIGALGRGPQLRHHFGLGRADLVFLLKSVFDVHAELLGQVADMAHRGLHRVALAQVLGDGLGLRGAFDDDEFGQGGLLGWPTRFG